MSEMFNEFLQVFLMATLPPLAAMLAAFFLGIVRKVWAELNEKAGDWDWALETGAQMAVRASEQVNIKGLAAEKKEYALQALRCYLEEKGYKIDIGLLDVAIEAAVLHEFNKGRIKE